MHFITESFSSSLLRAGAFESGHAVIEQAIEILAQAIHRERATRPVRAAKSPVKPPG